MKTFGQNLLVDKVIATGRINDIINTVRSQYATNIAFQEIAYEKKRAQAEAYIAAGPSAVLSDYPLLARIAPIRNMTATELSNLWVTMNDDWDPLLDDTEVIRERALVAVDAAQSRPDIEAALATLASDLSAL